MKIEKLAIHRQPVDELDCCCVLAKSLVVVQPHTAAKSAIGAEDQQLVRRQIFPAVREIGSQYQGEDGKGFGPRDNVFDMVTLPLASEGKNQALIR